MFIPQVLTYSTVHVSRGPCIFLKRRNPGGKVIGSVSGRGGHHPDSLMVAMAVAGSGCSSDQDEESQCTCPP